MKVVNPVAVLAVSLVLVGGCASWSHGWNMKPFKASGNLNVEEVKEYSTRLERSAVTRNQVQDLIDSLEYVVGVEPGNYDATVRLAQAWIVKAMGSERDAGERGDSLRKAITLSERAMSLNQDFLAAVNAVPEGKGKVSTVIDKLDAGSAQAAVVWSLATLLYYEESLSEVLKITNKCVVDDAVAVLNWIDRVAPGYGEGVVTALRGMAAAVSPGASMVNVADSFDAAVAAGPSSMLNRWLRAVYLYRNFGDRVSEGADFRAIRDMDLATASGFMPMNRMIRLETEKCGR